MKVGHDDVSNPNSSCLRPTPKQQRNPMIIFQGVTVAAGTLSWLLYLPIE